MAEGGGEGCRTKRGQNSGKSGREDGQKWKKDANVQKRR